jgi:hypothetical protein
VKIFQQDPSYAIIAIHEERRPDGTLSHQYYSLRDGFLTVELKVVGNSFSTASGQQMIRSCISCPAVIQRCYRIIGRGKVVFAVRRQFAPWRAAKIAWGRSQCRVAVWLLGYGARRLSHLNECLPVRECDLSGVFFVCRRAFLETEPMQRVLDIMKGDEFHKAVAALPGYVTANTGAVNNVREFLNSVEARIVAPRKRGKRPSRFPLNPAL